MLKLAAAIALAGLFLSSSGCLWPVRDGRRGGYGEQSRHDHERDDGRRGGDGDRGHDDRRP